MAVAEQVGFVLAQHCQLPQARHTLLRLVPGAQQELLAEPGKAETEIRQYLAP
jgi:hypothetical protein